MHHKRAAAAGQAGICLSIVKVRHGTKMHAIGGKDGGWADESPATGMTAQPVLTGRRLSLAPGGDGLDDDTVRRGHRLPGRDY